MVFPSYGNLRVLLFSLHYFYTNFTTATEAIAGLKHALASKIITMFLYVLFTPKAGLKRLTFLRIHEHTPSGAKVTKRE